MFGGTFAPRDFAFCNGQLVDIAQNNAMFSLLGTTFGGDGRTTFGLPELRGRAAIHAGTGPGLTHRALGARGGEETHTLTKPEMGPHRHPVFGSSDPENSSSPVGNFPPTWSNRTPYKTGALAAPGNMPAIENNGGGGSHPNMQPWQAVNYIIALYGIYPSRA